MRKFAIAFIVALAGIHPAGAAAGNGAVTLSVNIRPAVAIRLVGDATAEVRIRLGSGTQAALWRSPACDSAGSRVYTIGESGTYNLGLASIPGEGKILCLRSTDGSLVTEQTLGSSAP